MCAAPERRRRGVGSAIALVALGLPLASQAQAPLQASSDVALVLDAVVFADEQVMELDGSGAAALIPLGPLPREADLEAVQLETNGDHLVAFDTRVELPGGLAVEPRDVARYDGASWTLAFDGSAHGVPPDAGIDAVTRSASGDLLLSFDTAVDLAADEDLVRFDGVGFAPYFDGSAAGVAPGLDLDAAHRTSDDHLLLSFDGAGQLDGLLFADEDLLEFDPSTGSWALAFDGSAAQPPWPAESDLDAVALPEPGLALQLGAGASLAAWLARRRRTRRRSRDRRPDGPRLEPVRTPSADPRAPLHRDGSGGWRGRRSRCRAA